NVIQVSAGGQASAEPNKAVINLAAEATSPDPNRAREKLASQVSSMRQALENAGISEDQIRTTDFSINEQREPVRRPVEGGQPSKEEVTYVARHAFEIELSDLNRTGEIIDVAVSNGATQVSNVRYTLSEERRRQVKSEALRDAMENARSQANTLASSAGLSLGSVRSISTTDVSISPVRYQSATLSADAGGTSIETGPVSVNAQVNVVYGHS
ncbi:MAG: SIMPL domain-containing protein, partial [Halobacteria archaeon]|nr:SIMPL domain-containing protein [Halobacteria archaeon]